VTECVFVGDRMNTVFKFYLQGWILFGCGTALLVAALRSSLSGWWRTVMTSLVVLALSAGAFTSATAAVAWLRSPRVESGVPTLDGMAYLQTQPSSELAAYQWLNREVQGIPVVLEAHGPSYGAFSRVSMNTGVPTVVGWEYHLMQQSRGREEIAARASDVREFYDTPDRDRADQLLRRYQIDFVFVGPLERRTYGAAGLSKFANWDRMEPVFKDPHVTVYATGGGRSAVKTWLPRVLPRPAGPALRQARGLAAAADGTFFVADFGNRRIQQFGPDGRVGHAFGIEGEGPGEFRDPCDVAIGADGSLWVADTWNHRIQRFTPSGMLLGEWRAEFYGPRGIAVSPAGDVYVSDTGHHRIVRLTSDGASDVLVAPGVLDHPVGIVVGPAGELYVADVGHRRIAVFSPEGVLTDTWLVDGWPPGPYLEPYLDIGPDGVLWVTDPPNKRVLLFDPSGRVLTTARPDVPLELPFGITVLDRNSALVTDAGSAHPVRVSRGH
jgi:DNA-binding beta-propeller fold protein YncE